VRGVLRRLLQSERDHALHVRVANRAGSTGPWLVQEPIETTLGKAPAPLADRATVQAELVGYGLVRPTTLAREHDARPQRERLSGARPTDPAVQRLTLVHTDLERRQGTTRHGSLLEKDPPEYTPLSYMSTNL
jgi:hypothetical protein